MPSKKLFLLFIADTKLHSYCENWVISQELHSRNFIDKLFNFYFTQNEKDPEFLNSNISYIDN